MGLYPFLPKDSRKYFLFCFRVDATAKTDDDVLNSPIGRAVANENNEALAILKEFGEIPDDVKFVQLTRLMNHGDGYGEKAKKEFAEMLRTMPVDLVKPKLS